jgi:hypothetical protein
LTKHKRCAAYRFCHDGLMTLLTPVRARTIRVSPFSFGSNAGLLSPLGRDLPVLRWPNKNSQDTIDYWLDLSQVMIDANTTILQASADVIAGDFGLDIIDVAWSDVYVRVLIGAGTPSVTSTINVTIIDSNGSHLSKQIGLFTEDLGVVQYPQGGPFLTLNGIPLSIGQLLIPDGTQLGAGTPVVSLTAPISKEMPEGCCATAVTAASVIVSASGDGGGTRPFTYTFFRALDVFGVPGTFAALGPGSTTSYTTDNTVIAGNTYWYNYTIVDSTTPTALTSTSATVSFTVPVELPVTCDCTPS